MLKMCTRSSISGMLMQQLCVNDYYGSDNVNTKDSEHQKRKRFIGGDAPNVYLSLTKKFPSKSELEKFFKNKSNKIRLQEFLKQQFKLIVGERRRIIYSTRYQCMEITRENEVT